MDPSNQQIKEGLDDCRAKVSCFEHLCGFLLSVSLRVLDFAFTLKIIHFVVPSCTKRNSGILFDFECKINIRNQLYTP